MLKIETAFGERVARLHLTSSLADAGLPEFVDRMRTD
jgi:hypothetical protein